MTKLGQFERLFRKNDDLRKKLRNAHRIYKISILILLIFIAFQSYQIKKIQNAKNIPITIISKGKLEQISDNIFQVKENDKDIIQFTELQMPPILLNK